eukprot:TRINITY_DN16493_c0_g1_i5.p1 TRINITY_DN16493_c0_g1~~TRINITY_DN16493_c0_g1_i5.p1  ORF type:complete len:163 (+),score=34.26 TRINITY_DN16493_c0_g1_i5:583-1071(+)
MEIRSYLVPPAVQVMLTVEDYGISEDGKDSSLNSDNFIDESQVSGISNISETNSVERVCQILESEVPEGTFVSTDTCKEVVANPFNQTNKYKLRTEPALGLMTTMEAIGYALGILEGEVVQNQVLKPLEMMVSHQARYSMVIRDRISGKAGFVSTHTRFKFL